MDAVEEIKSRLNIEDVIGEYVQLKRAGRNFKGLSPFTSEKSPSFMVSPEKGIWHDFSSGKGGNVFSFIMEVEGLDFKETLELLARKAGVDLDQFRGSRSGSNTQLKERLYAALEQAAHFYQAQFRGGQKALEYVSKKRQFTKESALNFRLGYAPNTGMALSDHLKKRGFTDKELQQAGLSARSYRQARDMFRGRLMIPLMDAQGRVIGFTARLLDDEPQAPKYINTPQTMLYDKGRHVFGLHLAKDALRREGFAVVVEGNLDVIASHQAGVAQVVATAGTALTEMHLKALTRFTGDIRLAFDQDRAGIAATERAIPIAAKVGASLSIITIPEGKDPDELVRKDPAAWRQAIEQKEYALDWLMDRYQAQLDVTTGSGKREFSNILLQVVRQLPDEVEQDHYINKIATLTQIRPEALHNKLNTVQAAETRPRRTPKATVAAPLQFDQTVRQNNFLCLLLFRPALRSFGAEVPAPIFDRPEVRALFQYLQEHPDFDGKAASLKKLFAATRVQNLSEYVKMLELLYEKEQYSSTDDIELERAMITLRTSLIRHYVENEKANIRARMSEQPDKQLELAAETQKLDELLNKFTKEQL
jgi:DNA primase